MSSAWPLTEPASRPTFVQILITERCNIGCVHCAVPQEDSPALHELPASAWLELLGLLAGAGLRTLVLSGGEAFLRKDLLELCEGAFDLGFERVAVFTNGLLFKGALGRRVAQLQQRRPGLELAVSFDGATAPVHDGIRGTGVFQGQLDSLDALLDAGGRVQAVNTVLTRAIMPELYEVAALGQRYGAREFQVFALAALGRAVGIMDRSANHAMWTKAYGTLARIRDELGYEVHCKGPLVDPRDDPFPPPYESHGRFFVAGPDGELFVCPPHRTTRLAHASALRTPADLEGFFDKWRSAITGTCPTCPLIRICASAPLGAEA